MSKLRNLATEERDRRHETLILWTSNAHLNIAYSIRPCRWNSFSLIIHLHQACEFVHGPTDVTGAQLTHSPVHPPAPTHVTQHIDLFSLSSRLPLSINTSLFRRKHKHPPPTTCGRQDGGLTDRPRLSARQFCHPQLNDTRQECARKPRAKSPPTTANFRASSSSCHRDCRHYHQHRISDANRGRSS